MRMAPLGFDNLVLIPDEARQAAYETSRRGGAGGVDSKDQEGQKPQRKFKVGGCSCGVCLLESRSLFGILTNNYEDKHMLLISKLLRWCRSCY